MRYKNSANVTEHLSNSQGLINPTAVLNFNLDDEVQALLLFSLLPNSWETIAVSVSNSTLNDVLTMDIAKDAVMNEELRRKEQGIVNESLALVTVKKKGRGRSKSRE